MKKSYVIKQHGCYRINGSRISLDSVVYAFLEGDSPETIQQSFPVLTLAQVYGAIAYYLDHQTEINAHLRAEEVDFEQKRQTSRQQNPELYKRLETARKNKMLVTR